MSNAYSFYEDRINSSINYGLSGKGIIFLVSRCAFHDSDLTDYEFDAIIKMCVIAIDIIEGRR